ncbi:class I adenylate-forming enzyme family protein [Hymenobacter cheonanensis]|uniref:class I adenylate-forming enzyme family protein n=1 Tax=Hymenobacter sp. CA2-7 TaxID=3063993 RepID=UPI002712793E|nr:class I adenylate-forming enzyme family protein [Hymenobacter sp. CA2-7]MDO7884526.1 class I adenylate-forming enzyme family protein [Hymenobacter sp. CA2-7]
MLTSTDFSPQTLPALLCYRATHTPNAVAYRFPELEQVITWAQLWEQVQQLAAGLARQGIRPGDRVALLLEGRLELVAALLGTVALGAVAVPLNTYCTLAELRQYLADARPAALLISTSGVRVPYQALATAGVPPLVFVLGAASALPAPLRPFADLLGALPTEAEMRALGTAATASGPALLVYTAGSTGQPKGVVRSIASFIGAAGVPRPAGRIKAAGQRLRDRLMQRVGFLNLLPLYHQGGLATLLVLLASRNMPITMLTHFNPLTALRVAGQVRPRMLIATPHMLQAMLTAQPGTPPQLQSLWSVALGAAAITPPLLNMMLTKLPGLYLLSMGYGSSEVGTVASGTCFLTHNKSSVMARLVAGMRHLYLLTTEVPFSLFQQTAASVCGRLHKDVEVRTLDPQTGEPLPAGQPGELAVRSRYVMPYASDDPATWSAENWFRTGDIGYVTPDNIVILTDRLKRLISRGGEKISPTEVEGAIRRHPAVADAYVVGVPDALYGEQVCAVVVEQTGTHLDVADLRTQLARELSQFKVPQYVVRVPALPLLGSGKVAGEEIRQEAIHRISSRAYA